MIMRGTDMLKMALKDKESEIELTLYSNDKIKKNKLNNDFVMTLLGILDDTEYTMVCVSKTKNSVNVVIKYDAIKYIVEYLGI